MKTISILCFILWGSLVYGQEKIEGLLIDTRGEAVPYALIRVIDQGQVSAKTFTNEQGHFELALSANAFIEVQHLTVEPLVLSREDLFFDPMVIVKPRTFLLDQVEVVAQQINLDGCRLKANVTVTTCFGSEYHIANESFFMKDEELESELWSVFPNPTVDFVQASGLSGEYAELSLLNANGQLLALLPIKDRNLEIDLRPYPTGTYYLTAVQKNGKRITRKLVKVSH